MRTCWLFTLVSRLSSRFHHSRHRIVQIRILGHTAIVSRQSLVSPLTGTFNQDFDSSTNELGVTLFADFVLGIEQFIVAAAFDILGNIVLPQLVGLRAGSGAVLEDEAVLEAELADRFE